MKVFERNLKNVYQKAFLSFLFLLKTILTSLAIHQMLQCFGITLLKWMKYKNKLTFAYYSMTFWDFKSLQSVPKTWQVLKTNPDFSLFFPVTTGTYGFLWNVLQLIFCNFYRKTSQFGFRVDGWVLAIKFKHFRDFLEIS